MITTLKFLDVSVSLFLHIILSKIPSFIILIPSVYKQYNKNFKLLQMTSRCHRYTVTDFFTLYYKDFKPQKDCFKRESWHFTFGDNDFTESKNVSKFSVKFWLYILICSLLNMSGPFPFQVSKQHQCYFWTPPVSRWRSLASILLTGSSQKDGNASRTALPRWRCYLFISIENDTALDTAAVCIAVHNACACFPAGRYKTVETSCEKAIWTKVEEQLGGRETRRVFNRLGVRFRWRGCSGKSLH